MAKLGKFKIPQQFMVGFVAGIFSPVLVWLISMFQGLATTLIALLQGRGQIITGTELGTKLLQMLAGKWAITLPDLLVAGIGGGLFVMLGKFLYDMKWSPDAIPGFKSTPVTQLALVLFYASVAATLVLSAFAIPPLPTFITLLVNSVVTAWFVVNVLQKQLNLV